jgi:hypothetical protein
MVHRGGAPLQRGSYFLFAGAAGWPGGSALSLGALAWPVVALSERADLPRPCGLWSAGALAWF